jgi:hypothetical protein
MRRPTAAPCSRALHVARHAQQAGNGARPNCWNERGLGVQPRARSERTGLRGRTRRRRRSKTTTHIYTESDLVLLAEGRRSENTNTSYVAQEE